MPIEKQSEELEQYFELYLKVGELEESIESNGNEIEAIILDTVLKMEDIDALNTLACNRTDLFDKCKEHHITSNSIGNQFECEKLLMEKMLETQEMLVKKMNRDLQDVENTSKEKKDELNAQVHSRKQLQFLKLLTNTKVHYSGLMLSGIVYGVNVEIYKPYNFEADALLQTHSEPVYSVLESVAGEIWHDVLETDD